MSHSLSLIFQNDRIILTENQRIQVPHLIIPRVFQNNEIHPSLSQEANLTVGDVYDREIFAILGVINLLAGPYLIVVTECKLIGDIFGNEIYQIEEVDILQLGSSSHLSLQQV